jgi:streptogramin lyase
MHIPTANTQPYAITSGPDGALWVTQSSGNIARITTSGSITEYVIPSGGVPQGITTGADGAMDHRTQYEQNRAFTIKTVPVLALSPPAQS